MNKEKIVSDTYIADYLLKWHLVSTKEIIQNDLQIERIHSKNLNYKVSSKSSYFIKQKINNPNDITFLRENQLYKYFYAVPNREIHQYLPSLFKSDLNEGILVIEYFKDSISIRSLLEKTEKIELVGSNIARALFALHTTNIQSSLISSLEIPIPWVLQVHKPTTDIFLNSSASTIELIKMIQRYEAFSCHLNNLIEQWNNSCLIHNDVKSANMLVLNNDEFDIKIIDWELAGLGNPLWDIGAVFSTFLLQWLDSIPFAHNSPKDFIRYAKIPLSSLKLGVQSFWKMYIAEMEIDYKKAEKDLLLSLKFCAARLLQSIIELSEVYPKINKRSIFYLQFCYNILEKPEKAARDIFGF